jgi:hypothetical protein
MYDWQMVMFGYLPVLCTDLSHNMQYSVAESFDVSYPISISLYGSVKNYVHISLDTFLEVTSLFDTSLDDIQTGGRIAVKGAQRRSFP